MRKQLILISFLGALLAARALHAQTPPASKEGGKPPAMKMRDCSQAPDPKACEERQAKMRQAHEQAEVACKGKEGPERRACMGEQMCAQAKDPAQCRERMGKHAEKGKHPEHGMKGRDCSNAPDPKACQERNAQMREAFQKAEATCKGKEGPERRACMVEQMCAQAKDPAECRARAAKGGERKGQS